MKLNTQLLESITKIKKIEQREGEMKVKMQKKIDSLLIDNKKKTEELLQVSKTIIEIQQELQTCREVNKLCEERLREREEMEMFAKGLWKRAENLERLLSEAKEKDEQEYVELKRYYEGEISKQRNYVNDLRNEKLDGMRNNSNGSLIELLKETQQELQNSENLVIILQAELWELKRSSNLDSKGERRTQNSFSRELIGRGSIKDDELSEQNILTSLEEAQQQFLGIIQIANKKHTDVSNKLKSEYRIEKKQEDKQNKGQLKHELTEKLMNERKKLYSEINSAISVFRDEIAMYESAAVRTNNLTELVVTTLEHHREILLQIELKTHNQVDIQQYGQKMMTVA